jgi:HTH-type transcriptional regulator/antitoxin HigA
MDIRLIRTDADYAEALAEIDRLWDAEAGSTDEAKLELLAMLVQHYERAREPLPELDPIEAIKFRMDQQGLTRKDLLPVFGTTARVSEVLGGKRALTLEMIRKLHTLFDIPLESLVAPAPPRRRRKVSTNEGRRPRYSAHPVSKRRGAKAART